VIHLLSCKRCRRRGWAQKNPVGPGGVSVDPETQKFTARNDLQSPNRGFFSISRRSCGRRSWAGIMFHRNPHCQDNFLFRRLRRRVRGQRRNADGCRNPKKCLQIPDFPALQPLSLSLPKPPAAQPVLRQAQDEAFPQAEPVEALPRRGTSFDKLRMRHSPQAEPVEAPCGDRALYAYRPSSVLIRDKNPSTGRYSAAKPNPAPRSPAKAP
jgi:hypothetical protein